MRHLKSLSADSASAKLTWCDVYLQQEETVPDVQPRGTDGFIAQLTQAAQWHEPHFVCSGRPPTLSLWGLKYRRQGPGLRAVDTSVSAEQKSAH